MAAIFSIFNDKSCNFVITDISYPSETTGPDSDAELYKATDAGLELTTSASSFFGSFAPTNIVKIALVSVWLIGCLWECERLSRGNCSFEEMCLIAKNYSKEVEYSEENLDALADMFYDRECFSTPMIKGLFSM